MSVRSPIFSLPTHEVTNMPPPIGDQDLYKNDLALKEGVARNGADWASQLLLDFGKKVGSEVTVELANQANQNPPKLRSFDGNGMRINQVDFHPAYHNLMELAISNDLPTFAWNNIRKGNHVAHGALNYLLNQVEGGVLCPISMTYSVIPALKVTASIEKEWLPRVLGREYDKRDIPAKEKNSVTIGMFMTEKQGGSDVRANSTQARPKGSKQGAGAPYILSGHKFFCSAPMSDAFLTLAYTKNGLSCFIMPRWRPDGHRNGLYIQRLKDKMGNKSNASSEIELVEAYGMMLGEEGKGVQTIIQMVNGNRYYCSIGSAGLMRQALVQALHYTSNRMAFKKKLIEQSLMRNVLSDMAIESEAATALFLRLGRSIGEAEYDPKEAALMRIGTAIGKYWICKRASGLVGEALECLGGSGYVEEKILSRLYREAPLNSIWEGSSNVICLDVLRAMHRDSKAMPAFMTEINQAKGQNLYLDAFIINLKSEVKNLEYTETRARRITEMMALAWQASLLIQFSTNAISDAFCASRLGNHWSGAYGCLSSETDFKAILNRAQGII